MKRATLPMNMGQAILDAKRMSHMRKFGNSAVAVQGGVILVPKRDGSVTIRRAGRGGDKMTTTIAEGLHECGGKRGADFLKCIESIPGFRAPKAMIATGGEKGAVKKSEIRARGFALRALT